MREDRRGADRRQGDRRLIDAGDEFLVTRTVRCKRLRISITQEGCVEMRKRFFPPKQCQCCPGLVTERRRGDRRSGEDRRGEDEKDAARLRGNVEKERASDALIIKGLGTQSRE